MEIHHLRYFLAVARELSFTKAAQNLHMSVAPLSQRIKALENELGEQLFDRSTHHVELTNAGERLVPLARTIVSDFDALPRKLLLGMPAGAVRVGVTRALNGRSRRTISDVLAELSRDHTYIVNQVASRDMERQLLAGSIDLGGFPGPCGKRSCAGPAVEHRAAGDSCRRVRVSRESQCPAGGSTRLHLRARAGGLGDRVDARGPACSVR